MPAILRHAVRIFGVEYPAGQDVEPIATRGQLESLRFAGHLRGTAPDGAVEPPPASENEPDSPAAHAAEAPEPAPEVDVPPGEAMPIEDLPLADIDLAEDTVTQMAGAGLDTVGDALAYLDQHEHFRAIRGIGKVTDAEVKDALKAIGAL